MLKLDDLERARSTFLRTRQIWFADNLLDAYERLALVTVAARLREFAFLNHLKPAVRREISPLLSTLGFQSRVLSARFDLNIKLPNVTIDSIKSYTTGRARQRYFGLGVWLIGSKGMRRRGLTLTELGSALGYPECCVRMDICTKEEDHELSLRALIREFGDDPAQVSWALRRGCTLQQSSYAYLRRWERRYRSTLVHYPFALHTACDECLKHSDSPSAVLNRSYESLAHEVSEELHSLILWAAHIGCGGRNR